MKRKATKIARSDDGRFEIYVDDLNAADILSYIKKDERHEYKWLFVKGVVFSGKPHTCFRREVIKPDIRDVYAMRFFVGQENDRIYCKKFTKPPNRTIYVVMSVLHISKKDMELSAREKQIIRTVNNYEYDV